MGAQIVAADIHLDGAARDGDSINGRRQVFRHDPPVEATLGKELINELRNQGVGGGHDTGPQLAERHQASHRPVKLVIAEIVVVYRYGLLENRGIPLRAHCHHG